MKTKIILILVVIYNYTYSQSPVVSLNSIHLSHNQNNDYHKDLDDVLIGYEGTWKGNFDTNKTLTIVLQKFVQHLVVYPSGSSYYEDLLSGKFEIRDVNGNVIVPFTSLSDLENTKLQSSYCSSTELNLTYIDLARCDLSGTIILQKSQNNNQLNYFYSPNGYIGDGGCPYTSSNILQLPNYPIQLIKQ